MLAALATMLFAASAAAATFPDRGAFAFSLIDDSGESVIVRHHGGAVRLEHEGRGDVVILLLPADGVTVYAEAGYGVQVISLDELMADDCLFDNIAEAFPMLLAPDAAPHPCVRMSGHDRLPPGDIPVWDRRVVANETVGERATTSWSVRRSGVSVTQTRRTPSESTTSSACPSSTATASTGRSSPSPTSTRRGRTRRCSRCRRRPSRRHCLTAAILVRGLVGRCGTTAIVYSVAI
jgi:hypothetical protein